MRTITSRGVLAALHVLAVALWASTAAAQPQPPEAQNPPMKIGPVELWPTMVIRNIGVDANVFNEATNPKRDFTATIVPNLEAVIRPSWMRLSYTAISEFVYFKKYTSERGVNRGFQSRLDVNLPYFQPFATIGAMRTKERQNTEIDVRARRDLRNYGAGIRTHLGNATSVSVGARRHTSRFVGGDQFRGVDLATELNNETNAIDASVMLDVTPLTSVGITFSKEEDRFDTAVLRNSNATRIAPTVSFKPLGLFTGSATVGYLRFDAIDPQVEDYTGLFATGTIGVTLVDRYRIETTFARDVQYSYDRETPTYISTSGRGTLRTDLFAGLDVKVAAGHDVLNYRPVAGGGSVAKDTYNVYSVGLGYTVRERIRVGVDAEFYERQSARAGRSFENNRIFGTLTWGAKPQ